MYSVSSSEIQYSFFTASISFFKFIFSKVLDFSWFFIDSKVLDFFVFYKFVVSVFKSSRTRRKWLQRGIAVSRPEGRHIMSHFFGKSFYTFFQIVRAHGDSNPQESHNLSIRVKRFWGGRKAETRRHNLLIVTRFSLHDFTSDFTPCSPRFLVVRFFHIFWHFFYIFSWLNKQTFFK